MSLGSRFAQDNLTAFAVGLWPDYQAASHHRRIARKLEMFTQKPDQRLMVFMPPRHGKSQLISIYFPAWYLGHKPASQIIFTTYAQDIASDFGRKVRNVMLDPSYGTIFPGISLSDDSTASRRFHTNKGGVYYAVGAGGPITSRGADLIIIDDITKNREQATSKTIQEKIKDWYGSTLYTRRMPGCSIVIVQTLWTDQDLPLWILQAKKDNWDVLSLPAISDSGESLWPERYPIEELERIKRNIGSRDFESLYQQRPAPIEGSIIKREWIKHWKALPSNLSEYATYWDLSFKGDATNDYVVGQVWARSGSARYLIDQVRARMDFPSTMASFRALAAKWPQARSHIIEDKANGPALIASIRDQISGVIPYDPKASKEARLNAVSPFFEAGNVFIPDPNGHPWVHDWVEEMIGFGSMANDDQVDATSMALMRMSGASEPKIYLL